MVDWSRAGDLFLPRPMKKFLDQYIVGTDTSLFYLNIWSFLHFLSGILWGLWTAHLPWTTFLIQGIIVHTIWEIFQILIKNTPIEMVRGRLDVVTDTFMFMIGMVVVKYLHMIK